MPKNNTKTKDTRPKPTQRRPRTLSSAALSSRAINQRAQLCRDSAERMYVAELALMFDPYNRALLDAWERSAIDMQTSALWFDEAPSWVNQAREKVEALWMG